MNDLISRSAVLVDIHESVVFSGRSGETSAEMRGAHKVTDRIKVAPAIDQLTWISVDERLPDVHDVVLAYSEPTSDMFLSCGDDFKGFEVTHWMPLPEPPMKEGEANG